MYSQISMKNIVFEYNKRSTVNGGDIDMSKPDGHCTFAHQMVIEEQARIQREEERKASEFLSELDEYSKILREKESKRSNEIDELRSLVSELREEISNLRYEKKELEKVVMKSSDVLLEV